jgi:DNA-directed RNA polymerase specialized sigma subunit
MPKPKARPRHFSGAGKRHFKKDLTDNEKAALKEIIWEMTGPHSQAAIAKYLGVGQQYVSEVETRVLRKMKTLLEKNLSKARIPVKVTDAW